MVRRQFGAKLFVPMTHELSELEFSYKDKGAIALIKEISEAWKQVHQVTPGNLTDATTEGYPVWHARRGSGFFAPKVYGPDLPIPLTDDAEDIRMEIEARYKLATYSGRKLNFFTIKQKTKR